MHPQQFYNISFFIFALLTNSAMETLSAATIVVANGVLSVDFFLVLPTCFSE